MPPTSHNFVVILTSYSRLCSILATLGSFCGTPIKVAWRNWRGTTRKSRWSTTFEFPAWNSSVYIPKLQVWQLHRLMKTRNLYQGLTIIRLNIMCADISAPYRYSRCEAIPKYIFPNKSVSLCDKGKAAGCACPNPDSLMKSGNTGTTTRPGECPACDAKS
jgi:hypothetical protein